MVEETNGVRAGPSGPVPLDDADRRILRCLAEDASHSYAELGRLVNLSAPAVHERVKRLRARGVIKGTVAELDGRKIGCPLLTFVHVRTTGWGMSDPIIALSELDDVEEIHTVTGDTCLILKVRSRDTEGLEALLERIYAIKGIRDTRTYVALKTYLERGPRPALE